MNGTKIGPPCLLNQGHYEGAKLEFQRVVTGNEKTLGPDHPSTVISVGGLAECLLEQGREQEAEQLFQRITAAKERAINHPS